MNYKIEISILNLLVRPVETADFNCESSSNNFSVFPNDGEEEESCCNHADEKRAELVIISN